jgi:hypothetical protein
MVLSLGDRYIISLISAGYELCLRETNCLVLPSGMPCPRSGYCPFYVHRHACSGLIVDLREGQWCLTQVILTLLWSTGRRHR